MQAPGIIGRLAAPIRGVQRRRDVARAHRRHAAEARAKYDTLLAQDPSREVAAATRADIAEYARANWGSENYAPWLVTYAAMAREFRAGCVPDNYVLVYMLPHVVGSWRRDLRRVRQRQVLGTDLIPEILRCEDGRLLFPDGGEVPTNQLGRLIFERGPRAFLKLGRSNQSRGIQVLRREGFDPAMLPLDQDFVVQHEVAQDPELDRFCAGAATTLRITTVVTPEGQADTREVRLRFARAGEAFVQARSNLILTVDKETGAFGPEAAFPDWHLTDRHPDSGEAFSGNVLGNLPAMRRACERLHAGIPGIAWLGWDLCPMANGGFAIMEVNAGHSDIKFGEAMHGPNYADMGWQSLHRQNPLWPFGEP